MKFGVVVFPGSNCDHDAYHVISKVIGQPVDFIWHRDSDLDGYDCIVLPGGFSYGDYLRTGAIASLSPIMRSVVKFADHGGIVLGICNGFQILCESGLLPGALLRNASLAFACRHVNLRVERSDTMFTRDYEKGQVLSIPIAHGDGNYFCDDETLERLEGEGQVLFRYVDAKGEPTPDSNPNGSRNNIAGIINDRGNVLGMMPHPERASEDALGSADGRGIFTSLAAALAELAKAS
ncbi:MAG: phosphoribosylformylglycinamidine synthase subunit PurQ [Blastocatellia bacterium]|jgi:phosphoribosylformylglycinamidine synthase|nr:phosphoribosylformylglycinamidine synthase subunit PurQ [Blastocatellia bacterium]MBK6424747.1 phosphoribosylformylglycinamidine synthase subunit PurQ [Blastocatellia bacterium]